MHYVDAQTVDTWPCSRTSQMGLGVRLEVLKVAGK